MPKAKISWGYEAEVLIHFTFESDRQPGSNIATRLKTEKK